jgi:phosphoribosylglycinamide formyltransferase-1
MPVRSLVFLASGSGGNLRFIDQCLRQGRLTGHRLARVIADRECGSVDYARRVALPVAVIAYRRDTPDALAALLAEDDPDLIVTNIHKILDRDTVAQYAGRLINLHYSLLPAFGGHIGEKPIRLALEAGCKIVGTTVHYVTEQVDAGPIIAQSALAVHDGEAFDRLMNRVFRSGCCNLLRALRIIDGSFEREADDKQLLAPTGGEPGAIDEAFWQVLSTLQPASGDGVVPPRQRADDS